MRFDFLSAAALLAAMVSAIRINEPSNTTVWAPSSGGTIQWDSVSTDQQTFIMRITGPSNPVEGDVISESVQTSAGSYSYTPALPLPAGQYRINVVSADPANPGILAQSASFTVDDVTASTEATSTTEGTSGEARGSASGSVSATDSATQSAATSTESVATPDPTLTVHSTKPPKTTATPPAIETPAQSPASSPNAPPQSSEAAPAPAPVPSADVSVANAQSTPAASSGAGKLMVPSGLFAVAFAAFTLLT